MAAQGELAGEGAVSFDSVLAGAKPVIKRTRICLNGDLVDQIEQLEREFEQARLDDANENRVALAPAIAARIVELTAQARDHEVEFAFKPVGRKKWRDLVAAHPPTDDQKALGADMNTEEFPAVAMAESCIAPTGATLAKFIELRDGDLIGDLQWNRLWMTCREANLGGSEVPLPVAAFALARGTEQSSAQPETTESLAASS
ncbi:hypothetical protein [Jatrophihabitans sp.]|uniref:hypothetical protein n=1 Tax=Jatrophihabitans sp. TaxID=1932789 RepID=UPI0030C65C32|nr:hypothetical protein [Jatrophihabitans sp.]